MWSYSLTFSVWEGLDGRGGGGGPLVTGSRGEPFNFQSPLDISNEFHSCTTDKRLYAS